MQRLSWHSRYLHWIIIDFDSLYRADLLLAASNSLHSIRCTYTRRVVILNRILSETFSFQFYLTDLILGAIVYYLFESARCSTHFLRSTICCGSTSTELELAVNRITKCCSRLISFINLFQIFLVFFLFRYGFFVSLPAHVTANKRNSDRRTVWVTGKRFFVLHKSSVFSISSLSIFLYSLVRIDHFQDVPRPIRQIWTAV